MKYKVSVSREPGAESEGFPGFHDQNILYSVSDDVILHSVAASCLLSAPRAVDFYELLQTSELSLRANQIMAIGLRGQLKRHLITIASSYLLDAEKCALGDVSARLVGRDDTEVTAMFGGGTKEQGEGSETTVCPNWKICVAPNLTCPGMSIAAKWRRQQAQMTQCHFAMHLTVTPMILGQNLTGQKSQESDLNRAAF